MYRIRLREGVAVPERPDLLMLRKVAVTVREQLDQAEPPRAGAAEPEQRGQALLLREEVAEPERQDQLMLLKAAAMVQELLDQAEPLRAGVAEPEQPDQLMLLKAAAMVRVRRGRGRRPTQPGSAGQRL